VNKHVLHFAKGELPPVSAFWNLSMYDDNQFFIENAFKRYSIDRRPTVSNRMRTAR
jgi:hypothetical protein